MWVEYEISLTFTDETEHMSFRLDDVLFLSMMHSACVNHHPIQILEVMCALGE